MVINAFFGWDFNSCEALRQDGTWYPIDFANACPDSQVTSLHYHFPWLIKSNLRWSIFCAATDRSMKTNLNWQSYFAIADQDIPFEEKMAGYVSLAAGHFNVDAFESFCATHLPQLDEMANEFFATDTVHDAIREKVDALYPGTRNRQICRTVLEPRAGMATCRGWQILETRLSLAFTACRAGSPTGALGNLRRTGFAVPHRGRRRRRS